MKLFRLDAHALGHEEEQVAHVGVRIHGASADLVMRGSERSVRVERVALEAGGRLVEVEMFTVLQAEV